MANQSPVIVNREITVVSKTMNSVSIRWTQATDVETPQNKLRYTVTWCKAPYNFTDRKIGEGKYGNDQYTITGLEAGTTYDIVIYVRDEGGYEQTYSTKSVTTAVADIPNTAPVVSNRNVNIVGTTATSVSLSWQKATDNETAQKDLRYVITYKPEGGTRKQTNFYTDISTYTLIGLSSNVNYEVIVWAYDGKAFTSYKAVNVLLTDRSTGTYNPSTPSNDAERRQQIRSYFSSISRYDRIDNVTEKAVELKKYLISEGKAMKLENRLYSYSNDNESFMPVILTNIYPGCLIYANKALVDGKPNEVDFYVADQLGTVTVYLNFIGNGVSLKKEKVLAEQSSINGAIGELLKKALEGGSLPAAEVQSSRNSYNSVEKMAIDMGCSVEYMSAKCKVDTTTSKSQETFYQMEHFDQVFYTVSVEPENKDITNMLGRGVTAAAIKKVFEDSGHTPIAYIKSVTYGRSGFYKKEYSISDFKFKGDESISYSTYASATSKQDITNSSTEHKDYCRIFGGNATSAGAALIAGITVQKGDTEKASTTEAAFTKEMTTNMEVSMKNQGAPISYVVNYLASQSQFGQKKSGEYVETSYMPLVNTLTIEMHQDAEPLRGTNSVQCDFRYEYIEINPETCEIIRTANGQEIYNFDNKCTRTKTIRLPKNCYFKDNEIWLGLYTRRAATKPLNKWRQSSNGYLNVTGGKIKVKIEGYYLKNNLSLGGDTKEGWAKYK